MTDREAMKLALEALESYQSKMSVDMFDVAITALRQALDQFPDATKMMELVPSEWTGLEKPPNSTTDVVESTDSLSTLLWRDLKTDRQRADWLRLGMGYQTGVVAAAIQQELAMAYERLVGFQKMHATLEQPEQEPEPVGYVYENSLQGMTLGYYLYAEIHPKNSTGRIPLYTAPPKRKWVGLTDDEIWEINSEIEFIECAEIIELARAIETKLRDKNGF